MKVTQDKAVFQAVTIRVETTEEAQNLVRMIDFCLNRMAVTPLSEMPSIRELKLALLHAIA